MSKIWSIIRVVVGGLLISSLLIATPNVTSTYPAADAQDSSLTTPIQIELADNNNSTINSVSIQLNGELQTFEQTGTSNLRVSINNLIFSYGETISVTVNASNELNELMPVYNFKFTTLNPPTPAAPMLSWINSANINTTDNQTIRIFRPTTINYIEKWGASLETSTGKVSSTNIPISSNYLEITNLSDQQIVTATIFWIDTDSEARSSSSNVATLNIGDRTAPYFITAEIKPTPGSEFVPVTTNIIFRVADDGIGISENSIIFLINNANQTADISFNTLTYTYDPATNLYYTNNNFVTMSIKDLAGNQVTYNFNFITETTPTPGLPVLTWLNSADINTTDNQQLRIALPVEERAGIANWRIAFATGAGTATTNWLPIGTSYVDQIIADNQTVSFAIQYQATGTDALSPLSAQRMISLPDKTPPVFLTAQFNPSINASEVPTNNNISFTIEDANSALNKASLKLFVNGIEQTTAVTSLNNTFSFDPAADFSYAEIIPITINILDTENNSTTISYSFKAHEDIIAPAVEHSILSNARRPLITFNLTDTETGISINTMQLFINGLDLSSQLSYERVSSFNYIVSFNSQTTFNYSESLNVSFNIKDASGNLNIHNFNFILTTPPQPSAPLISWVNSHNINTTDNQQLRIALPIEERAGIANWRIAFATGAGTATTNWLPIGTTYVDQLIADNQTVSFAIQYQATGTDALSPLSLVEKIFIDDRTAPYFVTAAFAPLADAVNVPTENNISFTVADDNSGISPNSVECLINGENKTSELVRNTLTYTFDPALNFNYGENIFITLNIKDNKNNSTLFNYKFAVHPDLVTPAVTHTVTDTSRTPAISFNISDVETGVSINSLKFFINGLEKTTSLNYQKLSEHLYSVSYNSTITYAYGETIVGILLAKDISGNLTTHVFNFQTDNPPQPAAPVLSWINSGNINTTDNQIIRLERPATIDGIGLWEAALQTIDGILISTNIPIDSAYVDFGPLKDNQTVEASVVWLDQATLARSLESAATTFNLLDRTPPELIALTPAPGESEVKVTSNIVFNMYDENELINTASLTIIIDNTVYNSADTTLSGEASNILTRLDPPNDLEYNDTIPVTINFKDAQNNSTTLSYTFQTVIDTTPPTIKNLTPLNNAQRVNSPCSINFVIEDLISRVSVNTLEFTIDGQTYTKNSSQLKLTTQNGGYFVEFTPSQYLSFWTTYNITINIQDIAHNNKTITSKFKTTTTNYHVITNDKYYRTLAEALANAPESATIGLLGETYKLPFFSITKNITILAENNKRVTIDAENSRQFLEITKNVSVTFNYLVFYNGKHNSNGGVISLLGNNNLNIISSIITGNTALQGGVFYLHSGRATINIQSSTLNNNTAAYGGVFASDPAASLYIKSLNSYFKSNLANQQGGIGYKIKLAATNCSFINNRAGYFGGAFYQGEASLENCRVQANNAQYGAVSYLTKLTAIRSSFYDNSAVYSAAISYQGNQYLENCVFYNNQATNYALISLDSSTTNNGQITNSIIWNNSDSLFSNTLNPGLLKVSNSNLQKNSSIYPSANCIVATPSFISISGRDLRCGPNDPGIDGGTKNIMTSKNYAMAYDSYDMGLNEYNNVHTTILSPEPNSKNVSVATTQIRFKVRDNTTKVAINNIKITIDGKNYPTGWFTIQDNSSATTSDYTFSLTTSNAFAYNKQIEFRVVATDNNNVCQTKISTFTTEKTYLKNLSFETSPINLIAEATHNLTVTAQDIKNSPMADLKVSFRMIKNTGSVLNRLISPTSVSTNSLGQATVKLYIPTGSGQIVVTASSGTVYSTPLTINITPIRRFVHNIQLNKDYLTLQQAFNDSSLSAGHTVFIDSYYNEAQPSQQIKNIYWPNKNNITLSGSMITMNLHISINYTVSASIKNMIFSSANNNAIYSPLSGTTLNIANCHFIKNLNNSTEGGAIYTINANLLNIINSKFTNNYSVSRGGAIYAYNIKTLNIERSDFSKNQALSQGGAVYTWGTNHKYFNSKRNKFSNNLSNYGSAVYSNSAANGLFQNNLIINNNSEALFLYGQETTINFCTLANNTNAINATNGKLKILNSILWNPNDLTTSNVQTTIMYSITSKNTLNGTNVAHVDPQFTTDYYLSYLSPAVNVGSATYGSSTDLVGNNRPIWGGYDLGAYEMTAPPPVYLTSKTKFYSSIQEALNEAEDNDIIELDENKFEITQPIYWPNKDNVTLRGRATSASKNVVIKAPATKQAFLVSGNKTINIKNLSVVSANNVFKVDNSSNGITLNIDGVNIKDIKAYTTYTNGSIVFSTVNKIKILVNSSNIMNCAVSTNTGHGESGLFYTSIPGHLDINISNSHIKNITANISAICRSGTINISNSTISYFKGETGAGFSNANVTLQGTTILYGRAIKDGGIFSNSNILANNCLLAKSTADLSGGAFNNCSATLNNCSIYENRSGILNTAIAKDSRLFIKNSVLWNNTWGANIYQSYKGDFSNCQNTITYSDCDNTYAGAGNFSTAPYYVNTAQNNFKLYFLSPLIDKGEGTGYVYDGKDIGHYEFTDTYINNFSPSINAHDTEVSLNISFRVRNSKKLLNAAGFKVYINNILYTTTTTNFKLTNYSSSTTTDMRISIRPIQRFDHSAPITVNIQIDSIDHTYNFYTKPPVSIYVANSGSDTANDGSLEKPFKTIAKAFTIAREQSTITVKNGSHAENITWPNTSKIKLIGENNSFLSGNITIPAGITANIKYFYYRGQINNSGTLEVNGLTATNNKLVLINNNKLTVLNSIFYNNTTVLKNNTSATTYIYYSNIVSNNLVFDNSGSGKIANSIIYRNKTVTNNSDIIFSNSLLNTDPLFSDTTYRELKCNSPAIDTATTNIIVSSDIRALARPQHHLPDIGAYEFEKPSIYFEAPQNTTSTPITSNIIFRVVDNINQLLTKNISIALSGTPNFTTNAYGLTVTFTPKYFFSTSTNYNIAITAKDTSNNSTVCTLSIRTEPNFSTIYVDKATTQFNKVGLKNYPFGKIQDALDYLTSKQVKNSTINIAAGFYTNPVTINSGTGTVRFIGTKNVTISGQDINRPLYINNNNNIYLERIEIMKGRSNNGGAIYTNTSTTLDLKYCNITGNYASVNGGSIYNQGILNIYNSFIASNNATNNGGAIFNLSKLNIYDSVLRGNKALSGHGGALYNASNSQLTLLNSILDLNQANNSGRRGGALYNYMSAIGNIYNCNFIRNGAEDQGAGIYNYYGTINLYNSVFYLNSSKSNPNRNNINFNIYNCYNSDYTANSDPLFENVYSGSYKLTAGSSCIDTGAAITSISQKDIEGTARPQDGDMSGTAQYDIGAYEYKPFGVLIPSGFGYYAEDQNGNRQNIAPTATLTIGREINGVFSGSITIPSANGFNLNTVSFTDLVITTGNIIVVPTTSALQNKLYQVTLPSNRYPFVSYNNTIRTNYQKKLINNTDLALTGNAVITKNYLITVSAIKGGKFSVVNVEKIVFDQARIQSNYNTTSDISLKTYTINNAELFETPINITTNAHGHFTKNKVTRNIQYIHNSSAEQGIITAYFETKSVTLPVVTFFDDLKPTLTLLTPTTQLDTPVTTAITFIVTDNNSGIDHSSLQVLLNNIDIKNKGVLSGEIFTYSQQLSINMEYKLTVNIQDNGGNAKLITFNFRTKADTQAPQISSISPYPDEINVLPEKPLTCTIQDLEAGLNINSLRFYVKGALLSNEQIILNNNGYVLNIRYTHPSFELLETIPVTISIADMIGNTKNIAYSFKITNDYIKPSINIISPLKFSTNNDAAATLSFSIADLESGIDTTAILIMANDQQITADKYSITSNGGTYLVNYKPARWGYDKEIFITINIADIVGNTSFTSYNFTTVADQTPPSITPLAPAAGSKDVDIFAPITILLNDDQTGINPIYTVLKINNKIIPYQYLEFTNTNTYNTQLIYQPRVNLDYLTTINIEVSCYDKANNSHTAYYYFTTADDIYPPARPTLNAIPYSGTTNVTSFVVSGSVDYGSTLFIYANETLLTSVTISKEYPLSTFALPVTINLTGNVVLSAIATDERGNRSSTSNTFDLFIQNNEYTLLINGTSLNVVVPAGALPVKAELKVITCNYQQFKYNGVNIYYALNFSFVPTGNDTGKPAPKNFKKPIVITMELPSSINIPGTSEIYYLDSLTNTWKNDGITIISRSATQITFSTTHFTVFGVVLVTNVNNLSNFELMVAPNPVKLNDEPLHFIYRLDNSGSAEVRIYSISGELLYKFEESLPAGTGEFTWTGENNYGDRVANGVYLVFVKITDDRTGKSEMKRVKIAVLN